MIKVTIHDDLLPFGVTSEDVAEAIDVEELPDAQIKILNRHIDQELLIQCADYWLKKLSSPEWWKNTKRHIDQYPDEDPYYVLNRGEFAEWLNMLFGALNEDAARGRRAG